jgi:sialic acid synthase SpsE
MYMRGLNDPMERVMDNLKISGAAVGPDQRAWIIAEIGVNHDGSVQRALDLVEMAAACGADAVKLQVFRARTLLHGSADLADYQKERCIQNDAAEMLSRYELSQQDLQRIVAAIRERRMIPLATPFSPPDVGVIAQLDLPAVKIASPDLVNRPLLAETARLGKPLLVSTGAATMEEVEIAVGWLRGWKIPFALLHCVSAYPVPAESANLGWINQLSERFSVPVGYSDHTTQMAAGALAVAAGACLVEKHITHDRAAAGPDHAASADPEQFSRYVQMVRMAEGMCGRTGKQVLCIEEDVRRVSRQSLVLQRDLRVGQSVRKEDLAVQRPGTGIPAAQCDAAVGRKALRALKAGTLLQWEMLSAAA